MNHVFVLSSEFLGRGDDELGAKLMGSFLRSLLATEQKPDKLIFYNSAVKLLASDSPQRDVLDQLNLAGVQLIACGTCVSYYKLDEKIPRERVSNMPEIVGILTTSEGVVTV